jgi:hypothetical protein
MFVRLNEGTREKPEFSATNIVVQSAGKDLKLPGDPAGHAAPAVTDWDGDGRWDILSGCGDGGVYFYRNTGDAGGPRFDERVVLIAPHVEAESAGYHDMLEPGVDPVLGRRTQIAAVDYDGDGKADLLVGDFSTTITPRADLSPGERQEFEALRRRLNQTTAEKRKPFADLRADFKKRFPGDAAYSDEAGAEWAKAYKAMRGSLDYKALEKQFDNLNAEMAKYLAPPPRKGKFDPIATTRGYVWLFQRK